MEGRRTRPSVADVGGRGVAARGRRGGSGVEGGGVAFGSTGADARGAAAAAPRPGAGVIFRGVAARGVTGSSRGGRPIGAGVGGAAKASRSARSSGPRRITFDRSIIRLRGRRGGLTTPNSAPRSLAPTGTFISVSAWRIAFPNALASGKRCLGSEASARSSSCPIVAGRSGRSVRTEGFKYIRNYLNERPHLQPCRYKDEKAIVQKLRELHAAKKLDELAEKLLFAEKRPPEELYDLSADPFEVNNLAADPKHAATLAAMRKKLADWEERTGDIGRKPEPMAMYDSDMKAYLTEGKKANDDLKRNIELNKKWASEGK